MARFLAGRIFNLKCVMRSPSQQQQLRYLNVHEYQCAELMSRFGVNVPKGVVVSSIAEVKQTISSTFATEREVVMAWVLLKMDSKEVFILPKLKKQRTLLVRCLDKFLLLNRLDQEASQSIKFVFCTFTMK